MTAVIFRIDKYPQENAPRQVCAIFPEIAASYEDNLALCYAHLGQHSACSWDWVHESTRPATPVEYANLKQELESLGYTVEVCKRRTKKHRQANQKR